jgi:hypothetical protein
MVPGTELCRRADRRAREILEGAESYAEEVADGSEVYRDRVMGQLEGWFQDSLVSVGESRQELNGVPVPRPTRTEETEDNEDNGRGWQVTSA